MSEIGFLHGAYFLDISSVADGIRDIAYTVRPVRRRSKIFFHLVYVSFLFFSLVPSPKESACSHEERNGCKTWLTHTPDVIS